jgi:hypothetical protein
MQPRPMFLAAAVGAAEAPSFASAHVSAAACVATVAPPSTIEAPTISKKSVWMDPSHLPLLRRALAWRSLWYGLFWAQANSESKQACLGYSPP